MSGEPHTGGWKNKPRRKNSARRGGEGGGGGGGKIKCVGGGGRRGNLFPLEWAERSLIRKAFFHLITLKSVCGSPYQSENVV